jgi:hypothetical protein
LEICVATSAKSTAEKLSGGDADTIQESWTKRVFRRSIVTIKWNDGHQSFTGHGEMKRVALVKK